MARLEQSFHTNDLPEDTGGGDFTPLPAGDYDVTVQDATIKTTNSGTGQYINLQCLVDGPTHVGRILFGILNIKNDSAKAEQIGRGQLGSILRALGIESLDDTDQLLGGPLNLKIIEKPAVFETDSNGKQVQKYPPGNEIKGYKAQGGTPSAAPRAPVAAKPAPAAAPAKAAPPWAKR